MTANDFVVTDLDPWEVAADGSHFTLRFICQDAVRVSCTFRTEYLNQFIMTFPQLLKKAMRARHRDDSLRLVYSAETIRIERSSDPAMAIATFVTADRFEISFGITLQQFALFEEAAATLASADVAAETVIIKN